MKLYELQDQLIAIDNILAENTDPETEEILESTKDELLKAIGGKIENILNYISDCNSKALQYKTEEERIYKKRKSMEKKIEYLKNMIFGIMEQNNLQKAEYGTWNCTVAKTPDKVVLDACDDDYPDCFKKWSFNIDKTALKQQMTDGKLVLKFSDGQEKQLAHLESGKTLRIN